MCHWLALCYIPGEHPDRVHAEQAAHLIYGDDVMLVQSLASWELGQAEDEARERERRRAVEREP